MLAGQMRANGKRLLPSGSVVWDNHTCLPFADIEPWLPQLHRFKRSGVTAVTVNIGDAHLPLETLIRTAARIRHFVRSQPDTFVLGLSTQDIRSAASSGKLAVCLDVEGVHALGDQISLVELLYDVGVRWMLLVYNRRNLAGGGCHDACDEGLTELGRGLIREMDRVGMLKCCSHAGYRTAREIMDESVKPVIFSHSNARKLCDHPRNIPDDLIKACAATGGVIGINGVGLFLGDNRATVDGIVRHVEYVVELVGVEHVGLGLDYMFDQSGADDLAAQNRDLWPLEWGYRSGMTFVAPEALAEIVESFRALGYPMDSIRGILGENLLRVADATWT